MNYFLINENIYKYKQLLKGNKLKIPITIEMKKKLIYEKNVLFHCLRRLIEASPIIDWTWCRRYIYIYVYRERSMTQLAIFLVVYKESCKLIAPRGNRNQTIISHSVVSFAAPGYRITLRAAPQLEELAKELDLFPDSELRRFSQ